MPEILGTGDPVADFGLVVDPDLPAERATGDPAVDPLAQEVRVAVVPGVLLDQVHQDRAQDVALRPHVAQVGVLGDEASGVGDLLAPGVPGLGRRLLPGTWG
jgi:hypothetical protein